MRRARMAMMRQTNNAAWSSNEFQWEIIEVEKGLSPAVSPRPKSVW
jgi:hypothetical protein